MIICSVLYIVLSAELLCFYPCFHKKFSIHLYVDITTILWLNTLVRTIVVFRFLRTNHITHTMTTSVWSCRVITSARTSSDTMPTSIRTCWPSIPNTPSTVNCRLILWYKYFNKQWIKYNLPDLMYISEFNVLIKSLLTHTMMRHSTTLHI